ncbi:MAG: hypothetical protein ACI92E_001359, partial [Oceanicoccus sp.]
GYGHVKEKSVEIMADRKKQLLLQLRGDYVEVLTIVEAA